MLADAPCPPRFEGIQTFREVLSLMGERFESGTQIVNIGAKLTKNKENHDFAWDVVHRLYKGPGMHVLAVEAMADNFAEIKHNIPRMVGSQHNISVVNMFAHSDTIVNLLEVHGIRRRFALLKMDIDSADYAVVNAILAAGFRPAMIFVECPQRGSNARLAPPSCMN